MKILPRLNPNTKELGNFSKSLFKLFIVCASAHVAHAQDGSRTWTGAVNNDFYNGGNWSAAGDFPNGNAIFVGDVNTTIERTSVAYNYIFGLFFNNTLSTNSAYTIGLTPSSGNSITWGGPNMIALGLTDAGSLTETINSDISLSGGNDAQRTKLINTGVNHNIALAGAISGGDTTTYSFTKTGLGTLTLSGTNTYDVVTTVDQGILEITNKDALGSSTANTVVSDGATVRLDTNNTGVTNEDFVINGTGLAGAGALSIEDATIGGDITLGSDATIVVTGTGTSRLDHNGAIIGTDQLTKSGAGVMVRSGAIGDIDITVAQGEYLATGSAAFGGLGNTITTNSGATLATWKTSITGGANLVFEDGSTFEVTSNTADQVTSNNSMFQLNGATSVRNWGHQNTLTGDISGVGGMTFTSIAGHQDYSSFTLTGTNTYTGATTVGNGATGLGKMTLIVDGDNSAATGVVTVTNGSTLAGSGTIGGNTTIEAGGFLNPGNSPGVLTFVNDLTLAGTTTMEIAGILRGDEYDGIDLGGLLTFGGAMVITSDTIIVNGVYDLYAINGTVGGDFDSITLAGLAYADVDLTQNGDTWSVIIGDKTYTFSQLTGDLTVVPEASAYALIAGLLGMSYVVVRRRRV